MAKVFVGLTAFEANVVVSIRRGGCCGYGGVKRRARIRASERVEVRTCALSQWLASCVRVCKIESCVCCVSGSLAAIG